MTPGMLPLLMPPQAALPRAQLCSFCSTSGLRPDVAMQPGLHAQSGANILLPHSRRLGNSAWANLHETLSGRRMARASWSAATRAGSSWRAAWPRSRSAARRTRWRPRSRACRRRRARRAVRARRAPPRATSSWAWRRSRPPTTLWAPARRPSRASCRRAARAGWLARRPVLRLHARQVQNRCPNTSLLSGYDQGEPAWGAHAVHPCQPQHLCRAVRSGPGGADAAVGLVQQGAAHLCRQRRQRRLVRPRARLLPGRGVLGRASKGQ